MRTGEDDKNLVKLCLALQEGMRQRETLDDLRRRGYVDAGRAIEVKVVDAANQARHLIDVILGYDDLPHRSEGAAGEHTTFFATRECNGCGLF